MKKSEKILLGVLGVVLLYAGYIMFIAGDPKASTKSPKALESSFEATIDDVRETVNRNALSKAELRKVELAGENIDHVPFYETSGQFYFPSADNGEDQESNALIYSGFLRLGSSSFAIVNGIEYAVGDELAIGGYKVLAITKGYVMIEKSDPATGRVIKKQIPLVEDTTEEINLRKVR